MAHQRVLAQLAAERHWTLEDGADRYRETAATMDLTTTVSPRQWGRWCAGELKGLPRPVCCRVLERMFGRTADTLLSPPGAGKDGLPPSDVSPELLAAAAEESTAQLAEVESAMLGPATLEQAGDDVIRLARAYAMTPPAKVVADAVRMRRRVQELLTRTAKPSQQMDLYLLLGELCGLLAVASFDLGDSQAATSHARAAWGYGEHIDHDGLRAWARSTQAMLAYWDGRAETAVRLSRSARSYIAEGTGFVRTCHIQARSYAHAGDRLGAEEALRDAWAARDAGGADELHDGVGGEFGFGLARQARCEGSVWVQLSDGPEILTATRRALALYASSGHRSLKVIPQARADLSVGLLLCGNVGAAQSELEAVFEVPPQHRITGLTERLRTAHTILVSGAVRDQRAAPLARQIRDFARTPAGPMLEAGPQRRAIAAPQ
jgi:hypothetical protein